MSLEEMEDALQARLQYLQAKSDEGFERPSYDSYLRVYEVLAQVRQAQAAEKRVEQMDTQNAFLLRIAVGIESLNPGR